MDELKKRYEENPRRFFAPLANEYRKSGDLEQAISLCQEHLDGQPGNMNGQVVYGQALFDSGRLDEAEATFGTALTLDPENLIALRHLGDIARSKNDAGKAVEWYTRVLDADPRNDEILAFIEELKVAAQATAQAAAPTPDSTPVAPRSSTPLATPTDPPMTAPLPSEAKTIEISAPPRQSVGTPTPFAPIAAVPKPEEPKRPSLSLMEMSLDFGSESMATTPSTPTPAAPSAPVGDLELTDMSFGEPEAAPDDSPFDSPTASAHRAPDEPLFELPPAAPEAASGAGVETGLGWEMGGNIDLDAPSATTGPDEAAATTETPQVFVTETMAELYLQQGFRDEALQVYRQLAEANPHDASLRDRIKHLESGDRTSMSLDAVTDVAPDLAPGTDSLIEMSVAAEVAAPAPDASSTADDLDAAMPSIEAFSDLGIGAGMSAGTDDVPPSLEEPPPSVVEAAVVDEPFITTSAPTPASVAVVAPVTARAYFASLAQRRAVRADGTAPTGTPVVPAPAAAAVLSSNGGSIESLFGSSTTDANDDAMGLALATAVGIVDSGAPVRGRPTQAAESELTLDSVFRAEAPARTSGPVTRKSSVLKFDQFFESADAAGAAAPESGAMPSGAAQDAPPSEPTSEPAEPSSPADDAQFNSWLKGLKGQ